MSRLKNQFSIVVEPSVERDIMKSIRDGSATFRQLGEKYGLTKGQVQLIWNRTKKKGEKARRRPNGA